MTCFKAVAFSKAACIWARLRGDTRRWLPSSTFTVTLVDAVEEEEEEEKDENCKNILMLNEKSRIDNSRTECVKDVKIYLLG